DGLAGGQVEVHLADQLDQLVHVIQVAHVNEQELRAAVDQVDVDAQAPASLVVHLDDAREERFPRGRETAQLGRERNGLCSSYFWDRAIQCPLLVVPGRYNKGSRRPTVPLHSCHRPPATIHNAKLSSPPPPTVSLSPNPPRSPPLREEPSWPTNCTPG